MHWNWKEQIDNAQYGITYFISVVFGTYLFDFILVFPFDRSFVHIQAESIDNITQATMWKRNKNRRKNKFSAAENKIQRQNRMHNRMRLLKLGIEVNNKTSTYE